jgi:hypothetical protein
VFLDGDDLSHLCRRRRYGDIEMNSGSAYSELISRLGRVRISSSEFVSAEVHDRLAARAQWLRRELIPRLDAQLGATFPLVVIDPTCWVSELEDGTPRMPSGRVVPLPITGVTGADGVLMMEISAVVSLEYSDNFVEGVLVQGFLGYVAMTRQMAAGHILRDKPRAANARAWLSDRQVALMARPEDPDDPETRALLARLATNWVGPKLLSVKRVKANPTFQFGGLLALDERVIFKNAMSDKTPTQEGAQMRP